MKHCDACNVDFTGDMARCPLCQNELRGEASPAAFPAQQIYQIGRASCRERVSDVV